jgi:hypothetical protein
MIYFLAARFGRLIASFTSLGKLVFDKSVSADSV